MRLHQGHQDRAKLSLNRVPRLRPHAVERLPGAQSILSAAAKEAFIRRVLFDVGGFALFRRVVVMLRLLQGLIFRRCGIAPRAFLRAITRRNRWHVAGTLESPLGWGERGTHGQRTRAVRQTLPSLEIYC